MYITTLDQLGPLPEWYNVASYEISKTSLWSLCFTKNGMHDEGYLSSHLLHTDSRSQLRKSPYL